jgi:hypothetical protein
MTLQSISDVMGLLAIFVVVVLVVAPLSPAAPPRLGARGVAHRTPRHLGGRPLRRAAHLHGCR